MCSINNTNFAVLPFDLDLDLCLDLDLFFDLYKNKFIALGIK